MTYVELINRINRVFPSTVDCDYRDVQSEEIWRKVYNLLSKLDILSKFDDKELIKLREKVTEEQKKNYRRKNIIEANRVGEYDYGYDQNNYIIKQSVLRMKEHVLNTIIDKARLRYDLIMDEYDQYNSNMGEVKEIEDLSNSVEIEDYITKLLTVSKEDNDYYRFEASLFTKNILLNYGFNPKSSELTYFINTITNKIEGILFSDSNYVEDKKDKRYIESSKLNQKSIKELAEYISTMMRKCLQNRKKEEFTIAPSEPKKERISERIDRIVDYQKQTEEQQRLVDRNKKIVAELYRLREKQDLLEKELEENTKKMSGKR